MGQFVTACPAEKRAWEIFLDGQRVDAGEVILRHPTLGLSIELGLRPEGYQGPVVIESGGGGSVTLPWFRHPDTGEVMVGLLMETRPNMGGPVLCITGGMVAVGETHDQTAEKEGKEEGGFEAPVVELPGAALNNNRLFWVADPKKGEGVHCYAVEAPLEAVEFAEGITTQAMFRPGMTFGKKPGAVTFMPWRVAIRETADDLAVAAIARLLAEVL